MEKNMENYSQNRLRQGCTTEPSKYVYYKRNRIHRQHLCCKANIWDQKRISFTIFGDQLTGNPQMAREKHSFSSS